MKRGAISLNNERAGSPPLSIQSIETEFRHVFRDGRPHESHQLFREKLGGGEYSIKQMYEIVDYMLPEYSEDSEDSEDIDLLGEYTTESELKSEMLTALDSFVENKYPCSRTIYTKKIDPLFQSFMLEINDDNAFILAVYSEDIEYMRESLETKTPTLYTLLQAMVVAVHEEKVDMFKELASLKVVQEHFQSEAHKDDLDKYNEGFVLNTFLADGAVLIYPTLNSMTDLMIFYAIQYDQCEVYTYLVKNTSGNNLNSQLQWFFRDIEDTLRDTEYARSYDILFSILQNFLKSHSPDYICNRICQEEPVEIKPGLTCIFPKYIQWAIPSLLSSTFLLAFKQAYVKAKRYAKLNQSDEKSYEALFKDLKANPVINQLEAFSGHDGWDEAMLLDDSFCKYLAFLNFRNVPAFKRKEYAVINYIVKLSKFSKVYTDIASKASDILIIIDIYVRQLNLPVEIVSKILIGSSPIFCAHEIAGFSLMKRYLSTAKHLKAENTTLMEEYAKDRQSFPLIRANKHLKFWQENRSIKLEDIDSNLLKWHDEIFGIQKVDIKPDPDPLFTPLKTQVILYNEELNKENNKSEGNKFPVTNIQAAHSNRRSCRKLFE